MRLRFFLAFALVALVAISTVLLVASQRAASEVRMFMNGSIVGLDRLVEELEIYYDQNGSWQGVEPLLQTTSRGTGNGKGGMQGSGGYILTLADTQGKIISVSRGEIAADKLTFLERSSSQTLSNSTGEIIGYLLAEGGQGNPVAEKQLISRLMQAGLVGAAVSLALALLVAFISSYSLLKPIKEMTLVASRMASGDLGQRVRWKSKDEMEVLATAFNQMASSLQQNENNRRAMTADIAHELRTPISIQRAYLEALQDGIYPLTPENLQPVLEQTELLTRLVDDLRTLALADAGELRLERQPVNLQELIRRIVERFCPEAESRQIRLTVGDDNLHKLMNISIDSARIEQILNNLISNALRHTPPAGEVEVNLKVTGKWVDVMVMDNGEGIPEDALPRLFERFFRADSSRSRDDGGAGLGLAIARQLALAHAGDLSASNRAEGGSVFTLRLPLNP